jgi:phosphatidylserine/phosphatidylglycerophosphate/cardiolipin synthase-like enzyme
MPAWIYMKCGARPRIAVSLFLASFAAPCCADPASVIHYCAWREILNTSIDNAEREIDMAAYVLTDWPILQALTRAGSISV